MKQIGRCFPCHALERVPVHDAATTGRLKTPAVGAPARRRRKRL
jgi:hypothetical protein